MLCILCSHVAHYSQSVAFPSFTFRPFDKTYPDKILSPCSDGSFCPTCSISSSGTSNGGFSYSRKSKSWLFHAMSFREAFPPSVIPPLRDSPAHDDVLLAPRLSRVLLTQTIVQLHSRTRILDIITRKALGSINMVRPWQLFRFQIFLAGSRSELSRSYSSRPS